MIFNNYIMHVVAGQKRIIFLKQRNIFELP